MPKAKVYLKKELANFLEKIHTNPEDYRHVADTKVNTEAQSQMLEQAYTLTQNMIKPWTANRHVTVVDGDRARSCSIGDLIEIEGQLFMVSPLGFQPVEWNQEVTLNYELS
jgi:hypothetical protein